MPSSSKKWIVLLLLLGIVLGGILYSDILIDKMVKKTVSIAVNALNAKKELVLNIEEADLDTSKGSIYLKGISLRPDDVFFEKFKRGNLSLGMLPDIRITEIELTGIDLKTIFWDRRIDSSSVLVKNLIANIYLKKHSDEPKPIVRKKSSGFLDSLHIKGLYGIDLGRIQVNTYRLNIVDAVSTNTISSFSGDEVELDGVDLEKREGGSDLFEFRTEKFELTLKNQRYKQADNDHETTLGSLEFKNSERSLHLKDFSYRPIGSLEQLASQKKYADDVFDVHMKNLTVQGLDIDAYRENHLGSIENILIDGMELKILKNKQKPDNTGKRPLLPHQSLKKLDYPIHIRRVAVKNSSLHYKEIQPNDPKDILIANLTHLNAEITYLTSIKDSIRSGRPLKLALRARLLNKTNMDMSITMPYNHRDNAFHYTGTIGPADLTIFNPLLLPSANIGIKTGKLESVHFTVNATPLLAEGELTMRYSHLKVDIPRKNKEVEHALSFLASFAIHKKNPKKNGKLRIAKVYYERPLYKGMGGFVTKSVLSGVINTIEPFAKNKKHHKSKKRSSTRKREKVKQKHNSG